jgi:hypothetical protein
MKRSILRVLEWREHRSRRELARSMRAASDVRTRIEALEQVMAAVDERVKMGFDERLNGGPRKVSALMELEQHAKSLLAARAQLNDLKRHSGDELARLEERRLADARRWRRDDVKLAHGRTMARRDAVARAARHDADDLVLAVPVAMTEHAG